MYMHACVLVRLIHKFNKLQFTFLAVIFKYTKKNTVYNLNLCNRGVGRTFKMVHL